MNVNHLPSPGVFDVVLTVTVPDPASLWRAAARRLEGSGLDPEDVDETIGSIDDPSIDDCLATLMLPAAPDGCVLADVQVERVGRRREERRPH